MDDKEKLKIHLAQKREDFIVKAMRRLKKYYDLNYEMWEVLNDFGLLLGHSKDFRQLYLDSGNDNWPNSLILERISKDKKLGKNPKIRSFLESLLRFNLLYDGQIEIIDNKREDFNPKYGRQPFHFLVSIKGMAANRQEKSDNAFYERSSRMGSFFDEIEIEDSTSKEDRKKHLENPVVESLVNTSEVIPSILKYTRLADGCRRLFISFPSGANVATLLKEYGGVISAIQREFFNRTYKGRPKDKDLKAQLIRKKAEEYSKKYAQPHKGEKPSLLKFAEMVGKDGEVKRAPRTLLRYYKRELYQGRDANNMN